MTGGYLERRNTCQRCPTQAISLPLRLSVLNFAAASGLHAAPDRFESAPTLGVVAPVGAGATDGAAVAAHYESRR
jgi:hypothetical protein